MTNKKHIKHPCDGCEKDKKQCRSCEHAQARAMMLADDDRMHRAARIETMTEQLPYNRDVYITHLKIYAKRTAEDMIIIGKMLLIVSEKEGHGNFTRIVEEEIGIPYRTARRFMNSAIKRERFPKIDFCHVADLGHVYALLEAPEEDLQELENKGILAGKDMDELNRLSVKEMRELIRELKAERESVGKGIEKEMRAEKKALENEIKRLSAFEPQDIDKATVEIFKQVDGHLAEIDTLLRHFVTIPATELDGATIPKVEGIYKRINDRIKMWHVNWNAQLLGEK